MKMPLPFMVFGYDDHSGSPYVMKPVIILLFEFPLNRRRVLWQPVARIIVLFEQLNQNN